MQKDNLGLQYSSAKQGVFFCEFITLLMADTFMPLICNPDLLSSVNLFYF